MHIYFKKIERDRLPESPSKRQEVGLVSPASVPIVRGSIRRPGGAWARDAAVKSLGDCAELRQRPALEAHFLEFSSQPAQDWSLLRVLREEQAQDCPLRRGAAALLDQ